MNDAMRDIVSVLMAVIGVATLAVLVSKNNQTGSVISSASSGFGSILSVAMGGAGGSMPNTSGFSG